MGQAHTRMGKNTRMDGTRGSRAFSHIPAFTMAHSSFSAEQLKQIRSFGSFRDPLYPEPDAIGKEAEESSSDESSEDATVPSPLSISSLSTEDERLDLEDVVPDIDQQIAQPTGSPTESLMDIDGENIRVSCCYNSRQYQPWPTINVQQTMTCLSVFLL